MNTEKEIIEKECYDFTESDIKKAYRPARWCGWFFVVLSILIITGMIYESIFIDIEIGLLKGLPLLLVILIPALFYFSGLRFVCDGLNYENSFQTYKKRAKVSIKIMLSILAMILIIFLIRILPPDNRVDELIIANAQIINYPYFDTVEEAQKYYILVSYRNLKIECSEEVFKSTDPEAIDIKEYGYKIRYRWNLWFPNRCQLLSIEKIKV